VPDILSGPPTRTGTTKPKNVPDLVAGANDLEGAGQPHDRAAAEIRPRAAVAEAVGIGDQLTTVNVLVKGASITLP
jgi:hypothetical protein